MTAPERPNQLQPENLPREGYTLSPDESLFLYPSFAGGRADGRFEVSGQRIPFKDVARIRVGGEKTYTDHGLIAVPTSDGSYLDGQLFIRSVNADQ